MWRLFRWLKYLFVKPNYDFVITNLTNYIDTSYDMKVKSYQYTAYCKNTGKKLHRLAYDHGYVKCENDLLMQLNAGIFPGKERCC